MEEEKAAPAVFWELGQEDHGIPGAVGPWFIRKPRRLESAHEPPRPTAKVAATFRK